MISINSVHKLDYVNIGLLILSCILAFIMPFELFLFAYGVLGPLHYLTEISWLHDKNYYSTDKRDVILLVLVSVILTVVSLKSYIPGLKDWEFFTSNSEQSIFLNRIIYVAFASSLLFAFVKNNYYKLVGILVIILSWVISDNLYIIFSIFLPTLIHVFLFTWLFMFYGSLKNRSKPGYVSVALHLIIPFVLFYLYPTKHFVAITEYGKAAYAGFAQLNYEILRLLGVSFEGVNPSTQIFDSHLGIAIMRFIAFAYTYHYLNWFSKTKVIRWHEIPKSRSIFIAILWVISIVLYAVDYSLGFKWLFLLSFMHVMLEFPLNYISFVGIFKELTGKGMKHSVN